MIFERWLEAVRSGGDPALRSARVLVRPHPAVHAWDEWSPPDERTFLLRPEDKTQPATLAQLLHESDAVVALNTSAELEAAIAGKPVLTFRAGPDARGQEGSAHFPYLLEANDGFVIDAPTLDEHVAKLAAVLRREHDDERIRAFVERFIRPAGIDQPVVPLVASIITSVARTTVLPADAANEPVLPPGKRVRDRQRILVVSPPTLLRSIPDVAHRLVDEGSELLFSGHRIETLRIPDEILARPQTSLVELPLRRLGVEGESVAILRTLADITRFFSPDLEDGSWPRVRATRRLLKLLGHPDYKTAAHATANLQLPHSVHVRLSSAFRQIERLLPPPQGLCKAIEQLDIETVLLITRCTQGGFDPDVIKAVREVGLSLTMLVFSWDNLASKAVLTEHPDRLLVWNDVQAAEAVELHGVPRERVRVVGAPNFDRFFATALASETALARPAGARARILYLGSSKAAPDEPAIFTRWLAAIRSAPDPELRDAEVLLRPHPGTRVQWRAWTPPDDPLLTLDRPAKGELSRLAELLLDAHVVVALSTSAELEAAIVGRPVVTFRGGPDAPAQEGLPHFHYLLEEGGGFVVDSRDLAEHVVNLGRVLRGDFDATSMQRFVERCLRPRGLTQPASPLVASAVLELANRSTPVSV